MSEYSVLFDLPDVFLAKVKSGVYKIFGGVIRDASNGEIVAHLKEIGIVKNFTEPVKVLQSVASAGLANSMVMCGFATLGLVCVAGFIITNKKLNKIDLKLNEIKSTLEEIKTELSHIKTQNLISFSQLYYQALEAFKDEDYASAYDKARSGVGSVMAYIENYNKEDLLLDKEATTFLLKVINGCFALQISCAYKMFPDKISLILKRYKETLEQIVDLFKNTVTPLYTSLPTNKTFKIISALNDKNSWQSNMKLALPAACELLENEENFINICSKLPDKEIIKLDKGKTVYIIRTDQVY